MCILGVNKAGFDQNISLGKEISKGIPNKYRAEDIARTHNGSEIIFQSKDGTWNVNELKEESLSFGNDDISAKDHNEINFDPAKMKKAGISAAVVSLIDEYNDDVVEYPIIGEVNEGKWIKSPDRLFNSDKSYKLESGDNIEDIREKNKAEIKVNVIGNPNTPLEILNILAKDDVEKNPETLKISAKSADPYLREAVAGNPKTPPEIFKILANDSDFLVKMALVKNINIPVEALKILAKDPISDISDIAKERLSLIK